MSMIASTSIRAVIASSARARAFHASPAAAKTMTDKVKETADTVNKTVGKTLASAIEKGEEATESTKETLGVATEKTRKSADIAGQKANQAAAGARVAKEDFKKEVRK